MLRNPGNLCVEIQSSQINSENVCARQQELTSNFIAEALYRTVRGAPAAHSRGTQPEMCEFVQQRE